MLSIRELEAVRAALLNPSASTTAAALDLIAEAIEIEKELEEMSAAGAFKGPAHYAKYQREKAPRQ